MSLNSNNSLFIKTYGKPRRTQGLGQDSLWHNDLVDDFDKCLGIEDVKQTTFLSPESVSPVSMYKFGKHKQINENKTKCTNGWSVKLQSTLISNKANSIVKKRNFEWSSDDNFNKTNLFYNTNNSKAVTSTSVKKLKNRFVLSKKQCSTPLQSTVSYSYRKKLNVQSTSIKKLKNKFILPGEQCSTPLTRSVSYSCGKKMKNISVKKKKKKIKLKTNLAYDFNDKNSHSSEFSMKSDYSHLNSFNLNGEVNDKSVLISGSHCLKSLNTELCSKNNKHFTNYDRKILNKLDLNKPKKLYCDKKKKTNPLKNSNWYNKVMNIICDNELCFPEESYIKEKQKNEEIITLESITGDHNSKSDKTCYTTVTKNVRTKQSEQQNQLSLSPNLNNQSFESIKYFKKSSSREEDCDCALDIKSNIYNISVDTTDVVINKSQPHVKYDDDESKLFDNSLGASYYEYDNNKVIENIDYLTSINITVDEEHINRPQNQLNSKDYILTQINQNKTSLNHNSNCLTQNEAEVLSCISSCDLNLDDSNKSFSDTLDNKLTNVIEHLENNKSNIHSNYNRLSLLLTENVNNVSENNHYGYNYEPSILSNITNKFSDISIDSNRQYDQFTVKDSIIEIPDQSSKFFFDKPTHDINNSFSTVHSSFNSDQNTVIHNDNFADIYLKKITDANNILLSENNLGVIKTSSNSSNTGDSYIINKEKFQFNSNQFDSLYNESEHSFENISSIKYEKKTINENQRNIFDNTFERYEDIENSNVSLNISRRKRYATRFQKNDNLDTIDEYIDENKVDVQNSTKRYLDYSQSTLSHIPGFRLEPGKKWRRSIIIVRNFVDQTINLTQNTTKKGRKWNSTVDDVLRQQSINTTIYQRLDQSNIFRNSMCRSSQRYLKINSIGTTNEIARKFIFDLCNQKEPISFDSWLKPKINKKWKKVGEGVYGEVFSYLVSKSINTVVKIIPIEGQNYINNERQKKMFEVYSEILISTELNKLFDKYNWNYTKSFCKLKNISCVQGKYPEYLIKLWKQYNNDKGSDNDNPNILPNDQMFMVLEMENGGIDVEGFLFNSAYQALFAFLQIAFGLAVAEQQFDFEHRDLHIGNILVKKVAPNNKIAFKLDGEIFNIPSKGIKITIIDFTLSRMTYNNKSIFNNLAEDAELFTSDGDYQFEIYRLMRKETNDQWNLYRPKTNIYWLHYVLDKMLEFVHYKKTTTKIHNTGLNILRKLKNSILSFDSTKSFTESKMVLDLLSQS